MYHESVLLHESIESSSVGNQCVFSSYVRLPEQLLIVDGAQVISEQMLVVEVVIEWFHLPGQSSLVGL